MCLYCDVVILLQADIVQGYDDGGSGGGGGCNHLGSMCE